LLFSFFYPTSQCVQIEIWTIHYRNQKLCRRHSMDLEYGFSFLYNGIVLKISKWVEFLFLDIWCNHHFSIKINSTHMIRFVRKSIFTNDRYIPAVLLNMIEFNNWHWLLTIVND
jgi:hypothetical protein